MSATCVNCGAVFDPESEGDAAFRFTGTPPSPEQIDEATRRVPPPEPETVAKLAAQLTADPRILQLVLRQDAAMERPGGVPRGPLCDHCAAAWPRHHGSEA